MRLGLALKFILIVWVNVPVMAQWTNNFDFSINIARGHSFEFNKPQNVEIQDFRHLKPRVSRDNVLRIKISKPKTILNFFGFSLGINYGEAQYMQSQVLREVNFPYTNDAFYLTYFSRNHLSVFGGLEFRKSFYDDRFTLTGGLHLAHGWFANNSQRIASDYQIDDRITPEFWWRYSIQIYENNPLISLDADVVMKFRINDYIHLNLGLNFFGARSFKYDYTFEYRAFNPQTEDWDYKKFDNFYEFKQPRRIDHVFYIHTGISYAPKWRSSKNKEKQP